MPPILALISLTIFLASYDFVPYAFFISIYGMASFNSFISGTRMKYSISTNKYLELDLKQIITSMLKVGPY